MRSSVLVGLSMACVAACGSAPAPVTGAPAVLTPHEGMAVPRGSRGRCAVEWFNCACSYRCRWQPLDETPESTCANACDSQPAPDIRCAVVDGWCGPVAK